MAPARFTRLPLVGDDPALRCFISERMNHDGAFHGVADATYQHLAPTTRRCWPAPAG